MALQDLGGTSVEKLRTVAGPAAARLALVCCGRPRAARTSRPCSGASWTSFGKLYSGSRGPENLRLLVRYTVVVGRLDVAELGARVKQAIGPGAAEVVMTTGQELIEQGLEQGRRQLRNVLERQLRSRFGDLGADVLARLEKATASTSSAGPDRVLTAKRLADVFRRGRSRRG